MHSSAATLSEAKGSVRTRGEPDMIGSYDWVTPHDRMLAAAPLRAFARNPGRRRPGLHTAESSGPQRLFSYRELLDQIRLDPVTCSHMVRDGDHPRGRDFDLRIDDVFLPIALGRGHIARQAEVLQS